MMDDRTRRQIWRLSAAQETSVAKDYRGARTPGSGSGARIRGDVRSHRFLFECKTTLAKTRIVLLLADLKLVERRALTQDRVPVLTFDINGSRYHVLTDADFAEIMGGRDGDGDGGKT